MPTLPRTPSTRPPLTLTPRRGPLYAVRWIRNDGREVRHRYFRRHADAIAYAARLRAYGRRPRIFTTPTRWLEVDE